MSALIIKPQQQQQNSGYTTTLVRASSVCESEVETDGGREGEKVLVALEPWLLLLPLL